MDFSDETMKKIRLGAWALVALALLGMAWVQFLSPRLEQSITDTLGRGDYELVATDGTVFTEESLKGGPTAIFFGFTHCPEVCPTTLGDIATWQYELTGSDTETAFRAYFITVDPERDTVEVLDDYVSWAPGVVGLTGSREEIDKAIKAFAIYARRVPGNEENYNMDHTASVLLFDADGKLFEPIGYGEGVDRAVAKIQRLLTS
ncbi:protein SCO1/2 [Cognatiyoonia koreensis]|uniref:Protein SCO1/2 n=1 Tax=Cognatiyoonia koreensis TaxID=364200 RepID=A0A1I0MHG4_9RHOB|nr:SCO family protein [Cognatiyoonia koreensis]SEV87508.1 protein SCO1/2 [Cognatiyoonia koreensis]